MFLPNTQYLISLFNIISKPDNVFTFLHNTKSKNIADNILKNGFEFQGHLEYTTDMISTKDPIEIKYFSQIRKAYGNYTVIIQISKKIINDYTKQTNNTDIHFAEILSTKTVREIEGEDAIYCLPSHFIKGYLNTNTAKFISNKNFNPYLRIDTFEENIKILLNQLSHKK